MPPLVFGEGGFVFLPEPYGKSAYGGRGRRIVRGVLTAGSRKGRITVVVVGSMLVTTYPFGASVGVGMG